MFSAQGFVSDVLWSLCASSRHTFLPQVCLSVFFTQFSLRKLSVQVLSASSTGARLSAPVLLRTFLCTSSLRNSLSLSLSLCKSLCASCFRARTVLNANDRSPRKYRQELQITTFCTLTTPIPQQVSRSARSGRRPPFWYIDHTNPRRKKSRERLKRRKASRTICRNYG